VLCSLTYVLREPRQGNGVFLLEVAGPSSDRPTLNKRHAWLPCESHFCNQSRQAPYMIASDLCLVQGASVTEARTSTHLLIILFFITGHTRNRYQRILYRIRACRGNTYDETCACNLHAHQHQHPPLHVTQQIEPPSTHWKNLPTNLSKLQLRRLCLESSHRALPFLHSLLLRPHDILVEAPNQLLQPLLLHAARGCRPDVNAEMHICPSNQQSAPAGANAFNY
jgi:hypothetical protein